MIDKILDAVKGWEPKIISSPCDDFPTLKPGDYVIWFNEELALVYEDGKIQLIFNDWIGDFEDPIPTLLLCLKGNIQPIFLESLSDSILVLKDDLQTTPLRVDGEFAEDSYIIDGILH